MYLPSALIGSRGLCISRHQQLRRLHTSLCGQLHSRQGNRRQQSCDEHFQQKHHFRPCTPVCMGRRSAKIATRKGAQDAKRAKVWGTIAKKIIQAAKACGGDPANTRLIEVLKLTKAAEVPKDLIDRNIKKATDKAQADYQEILYEAYGAGGTGFIMECLTDNVNRSATDVRTAIVKGGGKMADSGSVLFNFQRRGEIYVKGNASTEEEVMDAAMDAGADDVQPATGDDDEVAGFKVLTAPEDFAVVRDKLQELGQHIDQDLSGLVYTPLAQVQVEDSAFEMNEAILERLLTVDDVDAIHTNCAGLSV